MYVSLCSVVLAPDVKHEDTGNEQQRHHKYRHRSNLDSRGIVSVKSPHATRGGTSCTSCCTSGCSCSSTLSCSLPCSSGCSPGRRCGAGRSSSHIGCTGSHVLCVD